MFVVSEDSPGSDLLYFKGVDVLLDSTLVHTTAIRVGSFNTSSHSDRLLDLLGTNPNSPIRTNCRI